MGQMFCEKKSQTRFERYSSNVPMNLNLDHSKYILVQLQDRIPNVSDNKIKFFGLICIIVVTATIPLILPHLTHPSMVYHILLHVASLAIAIFLCSIAVAAYFRGGRARLLFMALGFITLAALEVLLLLSATGNLQEPIVPMVNVELPHMVLLVMITLFGVGILKVN